MFKRGHIIVSIHEATLYASLHRAGLELGPLTQVCLQTSKPWVLKVWITN